MPLVLAIKNRNSVVVASDVPSANPPGQFGQIMPLPNRSVLLMAGNLEAVRRTVEQTVLPKITPELSAAGLADLLHAALVLEVVPHIGKLKGRVELIVAGIDPVRHVEQPGLYYMDSAQEFFLQMVTADAVAAGATAAVTALTAGHTYAASSPGQLQVLAKECLSATKLRWPQALANHIELGLVTPQSTQLKFY